MKILIAGASGFLGQKLVWYLNKSGYDVYSLTRSCFSTIDLKQIFWRPDKKQIDLQKIEGFDAIVNLCGENIAKGFWTKKRKEKILSSRIETNSFLVRSVLKLKSPPSIYLCASAIGFYGKIRKELCQESLAGGSGFLASLCKSWEDSCIPLKEKNIRVINCRFGAILSPDGGLLERMIGLTNWGLLARLGTGKQRISWISLEDCCRALEHCIQNKELSGPVNFTTPSCVSNEEFSWLLARILKKPYFIVLPALFLRMVMGDFAEELLLSDIEAIPEKLLKSGFLFKQSNLALLFSEYFENQ